MTIKPLQPADEELRLERSRDSLTDWKLESRMNRCRSLSEKLFEEESLKCLVSDSNFHSDYSSLFFSRRGCITHDDTTVIMQLSWKSTLRGSSFSPLHAPTMSCASRRVVLDYVCVLCLAHVLCFAQCTAVSMSCVVQLCVVFLRCPTMSCASRSARQLR